MHFESLKLKGHRSKQASCLRHDYEFRMHQPIVREYVPLNSPTSKLLTGSTLYPFSIYVLIKCRDYPYYECDFVCA